ncbi:Cytochrome P450 [Lentzea waywayandensis]|uniref:Cytochrome P450 n=1 Tax=Lentzea waywayandensis TaxID=84724 RepID=A0A1I6FGX1_9PSEU|nr:cytochrome P450 [Lentzea waywayandensis]SFR29152.1 Cytochrome P450 [Lentzea waywayandensis]
MRDLGRFHPRRPPWCPWPCCSPVTRRRSFRSAWARCSCWPTPDQWNALRDNPGLIPNAVEEVLRAPGKGGGGIPRYARTDIEIDGVKIRLGDLVLLDNGAANHDPTVFTEPDRVDITRKAAAHLTFGHGLHYCIGAPLARMELQAVFSQLIQRFPTMRLAVPVKNLTIRRDVLTGGLMALPVTWNR